jgi:hypothetical protein
LIDLLDNFQSQFCNNHQQSMTRFYPSSILIRLDWTFGCLTFYRNDIFFTHLF